MLNFKVGEIAFKNKVVVVVMGDENDADYVYRTSVLDVEPFNRMYPYIYKLLPEATGDRAYNCDEKSVDAPEDIVELFEELIKLPCGEYGCSDICYKSIIYYDENGVGYSVH